VRLPRHAGGQRAHAGVARRVGGEVVFLPTQEGGQRLTARAAQQVPTGFQIPAVDVLAGRRRRQQRGVLDAALGPQAAQAQCAPLPLRVGFEQCGGEVRGADVLAAVAGIGADAEQQSWNSFPIHAPGEREVVGSRAAASLAPAAQAAGREVEAAGVETIHQIGAAGETAPVRHHADPVLVPGARDHERLHEGTARRVEGGRFVGLVDQAERRQQVAGAERDRLVQARFEVGELHADLVAVLELDLGVEEPALVEAIAEVEHGAVEVPTVAEAGRSATVSTAVVVQVGDLAVARPAQAAGGRAVDAACRRAEPAGVECRSRRLGATQLGQFGGEQVEPAGQFGGVGGWILGRERRRRETGSRDQNETHSQHEAGTLDLLRGQVKVNGGAARPSIAACRAYSVHMLRPTALIASLLLLLPACVFLAGAAVGAGAIYVLSEDAIETYFEAPREDVHAAARAEFAEVAAEQAGAKESSLQGEIAGVRYDLEFTAVTPGTTRVVVQARKWKTLAPDLDSARAFVDRVALRLP
jgi:hypothetical protein